VAADLPPNSLVIGATTGNATRQSRRSFIVGEAFNSMVGACEEHCDPAAVRATLKDSVDADSLVGRM